MKKKSKKSGRGGRGARGRQRGRKKLKASPPSLHSLHGHDIETTLKVGSVVEVFFRKQKCWCKGTIVTVDEKAGTGKFESFGKENSKWVDLFEKREVRLISNDEKDESENSIVKEKEKLRPKKESLLSIEANRKEHYKLWIPSNRREIKEEENVTRIALQQFENIVEHCERVKAITKDAESFDDLDEANALIAESEKLLKKAVNNLAEMNWKPRIYD
eukprot:g1166.t1